MNHLGQNLRVLEHGAGAQHVVVPGPVGAVLLEDGLLQALQPALLVNVGVGVVDEDAGLDVATGVHVAEHATASDAAADELAVVLEVHGHDGLAALVVADFADTVDHVLALLDGGHEVGVGALAHGHVVEVPGPERALLDEHVVVLVRGDSLDVRAGVRRGDAKRDAVGLHEVERGHDLVVVALAAAAVVRLLRALERDGEQHVAQALAIVADLLVDEGAVGIEAEERVVVLLGQLHDVLPAHHGLAAGHEEPVAAKVVGLLHERVHLVEREVERL